MGLVVPFFKTGDQRVCSNNRGDHSLQPPLGRSTPEERRVQLLAAPRIQERNVVFVLAMEHWTSSISSRGYWRGYGS